MKVKRPAKVEAARDSFFIAYFSDPSDVSSIEHTHLRHRMLA
jgi:hypothetical protein